MATTDANGLSDGCGKCGGVGEAIVVDDDIGESGGVGLVEVIRCVSAADLMVGFWSVASGLVILSCFFHLVRRF